jgi:hypothetical protein
MEEKTQFGFYDLLGRITLMLFLTGLAFYVIGAGFYLWNFIEELKSTKHNNDFFDTPLNLFWLIPADSLWILVLIGFPILVQIVIFLKFFNIARHELVSRNDDTLTVFVKSYTSLMCFGSASYCLAWLFYSASVPLARWSPIFDLSPFMLTLASLASLVLILVLIAAIVNCTRILIKGGRSDGMLNPEDLPGEQYERLCSLLTIMLNNESVLDKKDVSLRKVINGQDQNEIDKSKLEAIIRIFPRFGETELPLKPNEQTDEPAVEQQVTQLISLLTDAEAKRPAQIKPLRRLLLKLKEKDDSWIHKAKTARDFKDVSRSQLVKSLNKVLKDPEFFVEKDFKDIVPSAVAYFKPLSKEYFVVEKVISENRKLLDTHVLRFLKNQDPEFDYDLTQEIISAGDKSKPSWKDQLKKIGKSILYLGLHDHKKPKILEGITRFPYPTLIFFFSIFICVVYLFAFAFAFHDRAAMKEPDKLPALFMANEYQNSFLNVNSNSNKNSNVASGLRDNSTNNNNTNTASNATPTSQYDSSKNSTKYPTVFFFYASAKAGIEISTHKEGNNIQEHPEDAPKIEIDKLKTCDAFNETFQNSLFERDYTVIKDEQPYFRSLANKVSFCHLFAEISDKSLNSKKIFIEIVGRADDAGVSNGKGNPKQTYSANYELSLARAQNLKFEIVRHFQTDPKTLDKIEWSYLPVSNDQSVGGDYSFNDAGIKPTIINNAPSVSPTPVKTKVKVQAENTFATRIKNEIPHILEPYGENKVLKDRLTHCMEKLKKHIKKATSLFTAGKINDQKAQDALFSILQTESKLYEQLARAPNPKTQEDQAAQEGSEKKLNALQENMGLALFYFDQSTDNANKRIAETYVTSIPENKTLPPSVSLTLSDYILYSITTGYSDIKPTTLYAKFLTIFVSMVQIFFVVVFFNALMSLKRDGEDETV